MKINTTPWLLAAPVVIFGALIVVLHATDPLEIGPGGVLGVFMLIYLLALSLLFIFLHIGVSWVSRLIAKRQKNAGQREVRVGAKKAYYVASLVAFAPVLLLAMRSFAELKVIDIVLVLGLLAVVTFYILKRS